MYSTVIRHDNFDYLNGQSEMGLAGYSDNHVPIYLINRKIEIFVTINIWKTTKMTLRDRGVRVPFPITLANWAIFLWSHQNAKKVNFSFII